MEQKSKFGVTYLAEDLENGGGGRLGWNLVWKSLWSSIKLDVTLIGPKKILMYHYIYGIHLQILGMEDF